MRRGQTTVEYLLVISAISIAIAAVLYGVYNSVASQTATTGEALSETLTTGGVQ